MLTYHHHGLYCMVDLGYYIVITVVILNYNEDLLCCIVVLLYIMHCLCDATISILNFYSVVSDNCPTDIDS